MSSFVAGGYMFMSDIRYDHRRLFVLLYLSFLLLFDLTNISGFHQAKHSFLSHTPLLHNLTLPLSSIHNSTPLNRTRTIAPVMAGFSGGAALGPAAGGVLIDSIGS